MPLLVIMYKIIHESANMFFFFGVVNAAKSQDFQPSLRMLSVGKQAFGTFSREQQRFPKIAKNFRRRSKHVSIIKTNNKFNKFIPKIKCFIICDCIDYDDKK